MSGSMRNNGDVSGRPIAHVVQRLTGTWAEPHWLDAHLSGTAELAGEFAAVFGSEVWGRSLGMCHDTGKSTEAWQKYIRRVSGFDTEAHLEGKRGKIDHSSPGAKLAEEIFGKGIGRILAYCVAGHHAGLPDWYPDEAGGRGSLQFRLNNAETKEISDITKFDTGKIAPGSPPYQFGNQTLDASLWIRLLFSCLVDADFLDTEAYMNPQNADSRNGFSSINDLLCKFNTYMGAIITKAENTKVNAIRLQILADCRKAAQWAPGIFSLNVPTGGGKTLSSLAFGLEHARKFSKKRIIYVIPFTSIIEQNADVFRQALGDGNIVEHHSNFDENDSTVKSRLAAENWDAPVIVTTSVQFFESLFAAKSSRCRKLHNIVDSVVILDEAQLMPAGYLAPILQTIDILSQHYGVSFVISTATQPALECREGFKGLPQGGVREIIGDVPGLYRELKRVVVEVPSDWEYKESWEQLAEKLEKHEIVLCIVSDRKSCRDLHKLMPKGTYHLSGLMCGRHRSDIIKGIKEKLRSNNPVRVISTQLVEAGVDIDFPVVYRALAGLDSIAQAAGRCNREGMLSNPGKVIIFRSPKAAPAGILRKAMQTTEIMLKTEAGEPLEQSRFKGFFKELFWKINSLDEKGIINLLTPDQSEFGIQFRTAAEKFQIIDGTKQRQLIIPFKDGESLISILKSNGPERWLMRKLQRYSVNIYNSDFYQMQSRGSIDEVSPGIFALASCLEYSTQTGLLIDDIPDEPGLFIL